jgi:lysophospholipase L1-like esterase
MRRLLALLGIALLAACVRAPAPAASPAAAPAAAAPAGATSGAPAANPARFEAEIQRFEASDRMSPPAAGGIVFVGSSSFRLWPDLAADFPGLPVLNRGFGGSTLPEVIHFAPRIVLPYRPRLVVLYAGDNDLNDGRTPAQVVADYRAFVSLVRRDLPEARIAFVAIKPSPSRWAIADRQREANRLVREEIARDPRQAYVDVFTPMLGPGGRPRPELFVADSLHMTPAGYVLWRERLAPIVQ